MFMFGFLMGALAVGTVWYISKFGLRLPRL